MGDSPWRQATASVAVRGDMRIEHNGQDPARVGRLLWRRKWIVLVAAVIGASAAGVASRLQTPVYKARATIVLEHRVVDGMFDNGLTQAKTPETETRFATSPPVQAIVRGQLGPSATPLAAAIPFAGMFEITATATTGRRAAQIANAYAEAYTAERRRQAINDLSASGEVLREKIGGLQQQIDSLSSEILDASSDPRTTLLVSNLSLRQNGLVGEQAAFQQQLDQLDVAAALRTGGVSILSPATAPRSAALPATRRNMLLGAFSALLVGIAIVVLIGGNPGGRRQAV